MEIHRGAREALFAGYRPCPRCQPLHDRRDAPAWLTVLLAAVDADPARRWRDADLRAMELDPARVSRWFTTRHAMTFHAYSRARRLAAALPHRCVSGAGIPHAESLRASAHAFRTLAGVPHTMTHDAPLVSVTRIETPLGTMVAGATDSALVLLEFADRPMLPTQFARIGERLGCECAERHSPVFDLLQSQFAEYFARTRSAFTVPIRAPGTEFQERVWRELLAIPAGATRSYGDIARAIGRPTATRAVARANGDNRIAILIPCHRVIGADGTLTGYGGGLWRKQRLLDLEMGVERML